MICKQLISQLQRMIEDQFITLNTANKEKELSIYPAFPIWTIPLGNNMVGERKHLFINICQLINKEKSI